MIKKLGKAKSLLVTFLITLLLFEGMEHILDSFFGIDLEHYLTFGGLGFIALWGFKFHIICCIVPAGVTAFLSHRKNHQCNECDHGEQNE